MIFLLIWDKGELLKLKTKHGVILSDWQMCYQSDMNVQGPVSREYIQIIFCMMMEFPGVL